jgi:signal peptidase II
MRNRRLATPLLLVLLLTATVGCDRVTKRIAVQTLAGAPARTFLGGTVTMLYAENTGGFLSLGAELPPRVRTAVFVGATGLLLVVLAAAIVRQRRDPWSLLGAALFLAGGASNWIDRAAHGKVVDFLNLGVGSVRTGVFNVADVAIMAGLVLLVAIELRPRAVS